MGGLAASPIKPPRPQEPRLQLQRGRGSPCPPSSSQLRRKRSSWDPASCPLYSLHELFPTNSLRPPVNPPPRDSPDSEHGAVCGPAWPWRPQSPVSAMIQTTWRWMHGWSSHRHSGQTFARLSETSISVPFGFGSCGLGTAGLPSLSVDALLRIITSREESHRKQRRTPRRNTGESLPRNFYGFRPGLPVQL